MSAPAPTEIPNAARIYNYTLGGTHYFPADAAAAEQMFAAVPSTRKWVRMLRDFLGAAAASLHAEGFRHFVDFASGLPTDDHVHAAAPGARVVYSDLDPYTIEQGRRMVEGNENVLYLAGDVREARRILQSPEVAAHLGNERRVALGLNGITVFLAPDEIRALFRDLYDWAAPGSKLYITYETRAPGETTPRMREFEEMFRRAGAPFHLYTLEESIEMSAPWRLPAGGPVPIAEFLGRPAGYVTEADREGVGLEFYAAILEKPADAGA